MVLWLIIIAIISFIWLYKLNKDYSILTFAKRIKTVDGTPLEQTAPVVKGKTIFGNTFDLIGLDNVAFFRYSRQLAAEYKKSYIQYIYGSPVYNVISPEDAELVLNDQTLITKGLVYSFLHPFIGTGLLTSTDKKWHTRRKMLTPAFHFNILGQFEEIFKEESLKFIKNLQANSSDVISVSDLIPKFTLNSVCELKRILNSSETALGVQLDECSNDDEYRASFKMIEECFVKRVANSFYTSEGIFNFFEGAKIKPHLKIVHEFSSDIIAKRRRLFAEEMRQNVETNDTEDIDFAFKKKRYAMLDTLLRAELDGLIDHVGICEEVDTFMFEGFDTTSMALIFGLMNLSLNPEMQEKCYQELLSNVDDDLSKLDISQLNNLKYLDCFIKETLRLYPSVPGIMRVSARETKLANNLILPADTEIAVHIFDIQRSAKHFPNPEKFDPERFTPENTAGRHPFAFVPFSAGQRNCIGQKFAMLEMKTLLVYVLKHFKLLPVTDLKEFEFEIGIILRSKINIKVKLVKRN